MTRRSIGHRDLPLPCRLARVGGTITRVWDGLDRLTSETTAQGTVGYTYDAASRRTKLTVPGQADVTYGYDNANRPTSGKRPVKAA